MAEKVKIGPVTYTVLEVPDLCDDGGTPLIGEVTTFDSTIRIAGGLSDELWDVALWHEKVHIILDQAGRAEAIDEGLINCLAYGLAQLEKANK